MSEFQPDIKQILQNAQNAGVTKIITVGFNLPSSRESIEIANQQQNIWATVGVHPYDAKDIHDQKYLTELEELIKNQPKIVAVGEIGLDYHYDKIDQNQQQQVFEDQIKLAVKYQLPIIIHSREAEADTLEILQKYPQVPKVIHCFPGGADFAKKCLELDCYLSFTGIATFKNAQNVRDAVELCPLDKIMLETDCPYLAPQKYRGQRNEPAYVREVAQKIAEVKNTSLEEIATITTNNAENFFNLKR